MSVETLFRIQGKEASEFSVVRESISSELRRFFLEMSDPSVDVLERTATSLVELSYDDLLSLQAKLMGAVYESTLKKSLLDQGLSEDEVNKIEVGAANTERLVDQIHNRFGFGQRESGENYDSREVAEETFERIQVNKAENELRELTELAKNETNLGARNRIARRLRRKIHTFIDRFNVTLPRRHKPDEIIKPTWKNLTDLFAYDLQINLKDSTMNSWVLTETIAIAHAAAKRLSWEKKFEQLPAFDRSELESLRLEFGAKAANLIMLENMAKSINKLRGRFEMLELAVPEFMAVPASLYDAWKKGEDIDQELLHYFEWTQTLKAENQWGNEIDKPSDYMVRSSAVFSEDGEQVTGAGIYESVRVAGNSTFQEFRDAVIKVYQSTDSENARYYRERYGIETESMGLVIQKYKEPHTLISVRGEKSETGYVNSRMPGVPNLMEISTLISRNFVRRDELDFFLALDEDFHENAFSSVHHFEPDIFKSDQHMIVRVAQLALTIEKIWGQNVQMEFIADGHIINFVQVRQIPESTTESSQHIMFPVGEEAIHSGAAIGIGDKVLEVLSNKDYNRDKTGAVIIPTNDMWTMRGGPGDLPKEGAVIIADSAGQGGHIQTLCAELGLICIYPDFGDFEKPTLAYHELVDLKKIRVVANGIEGRLYKVD